MYNFITKMTVNFVILPSNYPYIQNLKFWTLTKTGTFGCFKNKCLPKIVTSTSLGYLLNASCTSNIDCCSQSKGALFPQKFVLLNSTFWHSENPKTKKFKLFCFALSYCWNSPTYITEKIVKSYCNDLDSWGSVKNRTMWKSFVNHIHEFNLQKKALFIDCSRFRWWFL